MEIKSLKGQSLFDLALIATGDASAAFAIAEENNITVDAVIAPGAILSYSGEVINQDVVDYYSLNGIEPATQLTSDDNHSRIFDYVFDEIFE